MKISLIDSFYKHVQSGVEYRFPDKSELKPKSKRMEQESELFNTFIVLFCEGSLPSELKNHIRFFPENRVIKKNLENVAAFRIQKKFHLNLRHFDQPAFLDFTESLLDVDYALLIQQDPTVRKKNRYALTHFHVKIDWPIADAAEDLARWLRYIQAGLYENGDRTGHILQNKLFEYYGTHHSVGGRRTAALIAAQLLRKTDFLGTVYVSSSENRSMTKYSERGVSRFFLIRLTRKEIQALAKKEGMEPGTFTATYLYTADSHYVGISEAVYDYTVYSRPPEDGKLRKLRPAYNWLKLADEFLHPRADSPNARPINYSWVYASE
ncbi:MAG: hypothetical protein K9M82_09690 [Deltaproteobacteria bacterium]|nr:hypothetical protein [Deltaproteobacteria bacterium]